jgi:probable HAF family extracellular repeat protein
MRDGRRRWTQFGTAPLLTNRAFYWNGTTMQQIGTLGGTASIGEAINAKNQIVGYSTTSGDAEHHGFLWQNGLMQDLGTLGGRFSFAVAINNSGQVIGFSEMADKEVRAFLWENGKMRQVRDLIAANDPLKSVVELGDAIDINNLGQIVARGLNAENRPRAYLLSPSYKVTSFISPSTDSSKLGSTVRIAVGLLDAVNTRISDSRAMLLASAPCRVVVLASGAQTLAKKCMTYDAAANQFFFNWNLRTTGTGIATIEVRVNYGAPGPLKTIKSKTITITG